MRFLNILILGTAAMFMMMELVESKPATFLVETTDADADADADNGKDYWGVEYHNFPTHAWRRRVNISNFYLNPLISTIL